MCSIFSQWNQNPQALPMANPQYILRVCIVDEGHPVLLIWSLKKGYPRGHFSLSGTLKSVLWAPPLLSSASAAPFCHSVSFFYNSTDGLANKCMSGSHFPCSVCCSCSILLTLTVSGFSLIFKNSCWLSIACILAINLHHLKSLLFSCHVTITFLVSVIIDLWAALITLFWSHNSPIPLSIKVAHPTNHRGKIFDWKY